MFCVSYQIKIMSNIYFNHVYFFFKLNSAPKMLQSILYILKFILKILLCLIYYHKNEFNSLIFLVTNCTIRFK